MCYIISAESYWGMNDLLNGRYGSTLKGSDILSLWNLTKKPKLLIQVPKQTNPRLPACYSSNLLNGVKDTKVGIQYLQLDRARDTAFNIDSGSNPSDFLSE